MLWKVVLVFYVNLWVLVAMAWFWNRWLLLCVDVVPKGQLEALPEGWKELAHETGMSIYIHLKTRVVTWSRPYYLDNRYAKVGFYNL